MNEKNVWSVAVIAYGFTAVSAISLCFSRLARNRQADALTFIQIVNAIFTPVLFAISLVKLLSLGDGEQAVEAVCPEE